MDYLCDPSIAMLEQAQPGINSQCDKKSSFMKCDSANILSSKSFMIDNDCKNDFHPHSQNRKDNNNSTCEIESTSTNAVKSNSEVNNKIIGDQEAHNVLDSFCSINTDISNFSKQIGLKEVTALVTPTDDDSPSAIINSISITRAEKEPLDAIGDTNLTTIRTPNQLPLSVKSKALGIEGEDKSPPVPSPKKVPISRQQKLAGLYRPSTSFSTMPKIQYSKNQVLTDLTSKSCGLSLLEPIEPGSKSWGTPINIKDCEIPQAKTCYIENNFSKDSKWKLLRSHPKSSIGHSPSLTSCNRPVKADNHFDKGRTSSQETITILKNIVDTLDIPQKDFEKMSHGKGDVTGLNIKLLPHQIKGLAFLTHRESSKITNKGGFLCDDMGLGKTIQSISLILINSYKANLAVETKTIKTTLVVAPLALIHQWAGEIKDKAQNLSVLIYHGSNRSKFVDSFADYDVVVTTYSVVSIDYAKHKGLFSQVWWRIILDEAHTIKNPKTEMSKAACDLKSARRWCLTGTPIQNSLEDLYSLICFLQIGPYNNKSVWNEQIKIPMSSGKEKLALQRLQVVLSGIMLRRTKVALEESGTFKLPNRRVYRRMLTFSESEKEFYNILEKRVSCALQDKDKNYITALLLLLRLRQACDHCALANGDISKELCSVDSFQIVSSDVDELVHDFEDLQIDGNQDEFVSSFTTSTKIDEILSILKRDPQRKTIVFSQFTAMLDMIEPALNINKITFKRYDGSMTASKREQSLNFFRKDPKCTVLLCSLKCGALGLNLICASQVILVDPWWNPMVSEQAIDRVHRLGQLHDVDVYELVMSESVEERIMELQGKKRRLARAVVEKGRGRDFAATMSNTLSKDELFTLFRRNL